MRPFLLGLALGLATVASASPPGYHAPRRYYTLIGHRPYYRPSPRVHLSLNLGYYNGDLTSRFSDNTLRLGYGLGLTQALSPHLTFTTDIARVLLKARDQNLARGYRFEAGNAVLSALLRYNILADKGLYTGLSQQATSVQVFVQGGGAVLLANPAAAVGNEPLPAEGNRSYPALAAAVPVGLGLSWHAAPRVFLTLDGRYYFTTTDLLDDISQRGNPDKQDDFATVTLQVEYVLGHRHGKPLVHHD